MNLQVILAIAVTWIICAILTVTNVFPDDPDKWGYGASTNIRLDVLDSSPWFRFPYPGIPFLPPTSAVEVLESEA